MFKAHFIPSNLPKQLNVEFEEYSFKAWEPSECVIGPVELCAKHNHIVLEYYKLVIRILLNAALEIQQKEDSNLRGETLLNTYGTSHIIEDPLSKGIIEWTTHNNAFIILDLGEFSQNILPRFFKHCNYHSFVRQLNMYDFNKTRLCIDGIDSEHVYNHHLFTKDTIENMALIRRKESQKCHTITAYGKANDYEEHSEKSNCEESLVDKIINIQKKQEKLQQFCFQLIRQNQVLLTQNQELAHKVKKESKKKERILDQVFRIIGVSITEFWEEFCEDTETLEEKTTNFKEIYQILMAFIEQNDLPKILKTLEILIFPSGVDKKKKGKFFKVVGSSEINFLSSYTEEEVEDFINETNILLGEKPNKKAKF